MIRWAPCARYGEPLIPLHGNPSTHSCVDPRRHGALGLRWWACPKVNLVPPPPGSRQAFVEPPHFKLPIPGPG